MQGFRNGRAYAEAAIAAQQESSMAALAELIPDAKSLSRNDKLRLIKVLAEELATDEAAGMQAGQSYAVWSPDHAFDAADVMLKALAAEGRS
jgi:hypothetical protein